METDKVRNKVEFTYSFVLGLIAFLIVLFPKMVAIGFILMFLTLIFGGIQKQIKFMLHPVLIGFAFFYLAYVVGALFTNNAYLAGNYLEYKLSFILFPILFSFSPKFKIRYAYAIFGLVIGVIGTSILGVLNAVSTYAITGNALTSFTSSSICIDHPTYYASFVSISLVGVLYFYRLKEKGFFKLWVVPYAVFAVVMIFLSYSIAAILFLFLLLSISILRWIYVTYSKWLTFSLVIFLPFILFFSLNRVPAFKDELKNTTDAFSSYISNPSEYVKGSDGYVSGDKVRLIMWTVSAREFFKHPFGVGTGNVDEALSIGLLEIGQDELAVKNDNNEIVYNPHNQFLQTGLEIGILGLLILGFILFKSVQIGFRQNNWFLIVIVCSLIFNSFFESMLQRQSGIVFYTMFICLFSVSSFAKHKKKL